MIDSIISFILLVIGILISICAIKIIYEQKQYINIKAGGILTGVILNELISGHISQCFENDDEDPCCQDPEDFCLSKDEICCTKKQDCNPKNH